MQLQCFASRCIRSMSLRCRCHVLISSLNLRCHSLALQVGDSGVGKTSILLRYAQGEFKSDVRNTVGVDLKVKMVNFRGSKLKLTIWDTGEQRKCADYIQISNHRSGAR